MYLELIVQFECVIVFYKQGFLLVLIFKGSVVNEGYIFFQFGFLVGVCGEVWVFYYCLKNIWYILFIVVGINVVGSCYEVGYFYIENIIDLVVVVGYQVVG